MLDQKIIQPSLSPWSSPIWIVPKKTDASGQKKWRIVIDYRKLNDITIGETYPIPNIVEILDQLGNSKYFTTLDLASGFHQTTMTQKDACKTAFSVPQGHFE
ncbi:RNA-directed DNA polymerase, partial [Pseudomonas aeruginosa]